jgi:hypothetical protein
MQSTLKKKTILNRINDLEVEIAKAREYLQTGAHAHWHGFRPLFKKKVKDGITLPPHKDWVKNVFIPSRERAIRKAEKLIDRLESIE